MDPRYAPGYFGTAKSYSGMYIYTPLSRFLSVPNVTVYHLHIIRYVAQLCEEIS